MKEPSRDFSVRSMKSKRDHVRPLEVGHSGRKKNKLFTPGMLDHLIDPQTDNDTIRRKELVSDFIQALRPRLNKRENEIFDHLFIGGYTHEQTAAFLLVSRPYISKVAKIIERKIHTLAKTYRF